MIETFKGPIARGTVRTSGVLALRLLIQAGTLLLVARLFGPQMYGAFAGIAALAVILGTLSTFGIHLVLLGEVARAPERRESVMRYALPTTIICGCALLAVYMLVCTFALSESGVGIAVLLAIGVTETLLQPLFTLPATEHLALGRIARSQLLTTLPLALRLMAAAAVFVYHPINPLVAYAYGYLGASLLALAVAAVAMPAPWPLVKSWRLPTKKELREAAGYAALNITAAGPVELDKTLAIKLLPLAASGMYAAGARIIGAAVLPVLAMMLSALPRLFREGQNSLPRTTRLLCWIFAAALTYSVLLAIALWFIAPALAWLFGPKYHGIEHVMRWLCLAVPGLALRVAAGNVLMAIGKPWMRVGYEVVGLAVLIVAAIGFTSHFHAIGMPLALACSEWSMTTVGVTLVYLVHRKKSLSSRRLLRP